MKDIGNFLGFREGSAWVLDFIEAPCFNLDYTCTIIDAQGNLKVQAVHLQMKYSCVQQLWAIERSYLVDLEC